MAQIARGLGRIRHRKSNGVLDCSNDADNKAIALTILVLRDEGCASEKIYRCGQLRAIVRLIYTELAIVVILVAKWIT